MKVKWVVVSGILAGVVLAVDAATKSVGVISLITDTWTEMTLEPTVTVKARPSQWGGECLEFVFTDLPIDFVVGEIKLDIVDTRGPRAVAGHQTAKIFEETFNASIDEIIFLEPKPITFRVGIKATTIGDTAYVDYCPVLRQKGVEGTLILTPIILAPGGQDAIENLQVVMDGEDNQIELNVSHPWNLVPKMESEEKFVRPR